MKKKLTLDEALLEHYSDNVNRSKRQVQFLYDLCSNHQEYFELEKAMRYYYGFKVPGNHTEVLWLLAQYRVDKWLREELFTKY